MGENMKFTDLDQYLFGQGTNYEVYKKLGAHPGTRRGKKGVYFAVWAPNAQAVSVIGDFNGWDETANPMKKVVPIGVYEIFVREAEMDSCISFLLQELTGRSFTKQIPMLMRLRSAPELHPGSQILQIINGKIPHGSETEKSMIIKHSLWQFISTSRFLDEAWMDREMRKAFIIIEN